jgi:site-specific DNA-cytosine methylase
LTAIFTEVYDAEQNSLPVHRRDSPAIRQAIISRAFVKYAGGKHRGRAFAVGFASSFYQQDPSGIIDTGDTSYGSHMSTGRSRAPQETPAEQDARLRAEIREEIRDEVREEMEQSLDQLVQQLVQAHAPTQKSFTSVIMLYINLYVYCFK